MEGLIPKIYKSLKRSKSSRQPKQHAAEASPIENIEDFYPDGYNFIYAPAGQQPKIESYEARSKSMHKAAGGKYWPQEPPKKLARFGSQRRMFSCISGAA